MAEWCSNTQLKTDLSNFVKQNILRNKILNFVERDYPSYDWSLRTLDRRLRYFKIYYIDKNVTIDHAKQAVKKELKDPGNLLGYRAMHQKIRQKYDLKVPRDLVHNTMFDLVPEQLEERRPGKRHKKEKEHFTTKGSDWVLSLNFHDKLMGYQNATFPIAVYGCIDTSSRKLLWLKTWISNSKPEIVAKWYLEYLYQTRTLPAYIRIDKGSETVILSTMHAYLRRNHNDLEDATDSVIYGPSTSNQV
ncbi:uncharacterized protein LOC130647223 [Hydractinia symbiolongicarpus]|uniref:uncharacterized protein LOC130647223 n=1 Tax=Hydractinia symbiolongicarpus TaxID=13093 RepID=UPI00254F54C8|nr:uncharacterized protein LOC130647223 [Hydractinia symbiolongicarpus]